MSSISRPLAAACLSLALVLAACGDDDASDDAVSPEATSEAGDDPDTTGTGEGDTSGDGAATAVPAVVDVWSRQPAVGQSVAAVYGEIVNPTDTELVLVAASSPVTPRVELHETTTDEGGMMTMGERDEGFVIGPGESLVFEPGGAHVMLLDIDAETYPAEVAVTFEFAGADDITAMAAVQRIDDSAAGSEGEMDHSAMGEHDDHGETDDDASTDQESGDDTDRDEQTASGPLVIDVGPLHGLDDELIAGDLAPRRQGAVVADYIALLAGHDLAEGSPEAELLALLMDLDAALADADLESAVALAGEAHDLAHAIDDGTAS